MNLAFVSAVMTPNLKIKEIIVGTRQSIPIPNQNIRRCPRGPGANPYNVAQHINGNYYLVNMRSILRIPQISTPYATNGIDGHGVREMCLKEWKMGTMVERYFLNTCPQKRTTYVLRLPLSLRHGYLTRAVSGAHAWAGWLGHRCFSAGHAAVGAMPDWVCKQVHVLGGWGG